MEDEIKPFVSGDKIRSITTIDKFKGVMNDLIRGYPAYLYYGIFEYYFKEHAPAIIKFLEEDGIIKVIQPQKKGDQIMYRVTQRGIAFATSMAQLEYSQEMRKFTIAIIVIGAFALLVGLNQLLFQILQYFP